MRCLTPGFEFSKYLRNDADVLDHFGPEPQFQIFQQLARLFPIDQLDLRRAVSSRLPLRVGREPAGGNEQSLVRSSDHRSPKVANGAGAHTVLVSLALKQHLERQQIDTEHA